MQFEFLTCGLQIRAGLETASFNESSARHRGEAELHDAVWKRKPLLRKVYTELYARIAEWIDASAPGRIVEIGSGIGNLRECVPNAICTDIFLEPWLDLVASGYALPFVDGKVSHLILFDVFHHLQRPMRFLKEAHRVVRPGGRVILLEPYISTVSRAVYTFAHREPIAWNDTIDVSDAPISGPMSYYAAQGNATRLFFGRALRMPASEWTIEHAEAFSCFSYFFTGGFSKRALYPECCLPVLSRIDRALSRWPRIFGGRCLVVLKRAGG